MKKYMVLVMVAGLVSSAAAFAQPTSNDSWDAIRSDQNVTVDQGAAAQAFGPNGFFNACVDGQDIRSLNTQPTCVETGYIPYGEAGGAVTCTKWANEYVKLPITHTELQCVRSGPGNSYSNGQGNTPGACLDWENVTVTLPTNPVFHVSSSEYVPYGEAGGAVLGSFLFDKAYQIPNCSK